MAEARARLDRYGRNELAAEKPVPGWRKFLAQFQDMLVVLLLVATAISTGLWLYERDSALPYEAIAIFAIVLLNAVMGYIQTSRAEQAIASLRDMSPSEATVLRDGQRIKVAAVELVPGDVMLVEEGDTIAADARLDRITGSKDGRGRPDWRESACVKGHCADHRGSSVGRPRQYDLQRHRRYLRPRNRRCCRHRDADGDGPHRRDVEAALRLRPRHSKQQLDRTGKMLGLSVIVIAIVMVATLILAEHVSGFSAIVDVLIFGVALAVAAVPEGLPAVVTAVLSLGVQRMAKRNAIVRHLAAVETLGSANVIASDKTGTLTKNQMTVRKVITASGSVTMAGTGYAPEGAVTDDAGGQITERRPIGIGARAHRRRSGE